MAILNQDAIVVEDLDARDANNQPITTPKAKTELINLFRSGLFEILTQSELYSIATALSILKKSLNLTAFAFTRALPQKTIQIFSALLPVKKTWDKLLVLLSSLLVIAVSRNLLSLLPSCSSPAAKFTAPLVLRC